MKNLLIALILIVGMFVPAKTSAQTITEPSANHNNIKLGNYFPFVNDGRNPLKNFDFPITGRPLFHDPGYAECDQNLHQRIDPEWVSHYASGHMPSYDAATDVAVDASGNVYVTGYITILPYGVDYLTMKLDSSGNQIWSARYDGGGDDIRPSLAVDNSGNVYVTGSSVGTGTLYDYATVKYSPSGIEQWEARYNGLDNGNDQASAITVDSIGNVYVTGTSYSASNYLDYTTVKYDTAGVMQWAARYSEPVYGSDEAYAIAVDNAGNVYVTGYSVDRGTEADYATVKYDPSGTEQWVARYNGPGNDRDFAFAISIDVINNVYISGTSAGFETSFDYATVKYNSAGIEQWVARYNGPGNNGDIAYALAIDDSGNVCVTGYSEDSNTAADYATVKYDPAGTEQWVARYNGPQNNYDYASSIAIGRACNIFVTGVSDGDYTTIKYNSAGIEQWVARYHNPRDVWDLPFAMAIDDSENLCITGYDPDAYADYTTVMYNSDGIEKWVNTYDGPGNSTDEASAMAIDNTGNIYVTGTSLDTVSAHDFTTVKYNSAGTEQWNTSYNGPGNGNDEPAAIAVDNAGNVYVTGFSTGLGTLADYVTVKYNSAGTEQWAARYNGPGNSEDYASGIKVDDNHNVYVTGYDQGLSSAYDYATIKYNSNGIQQWVARYIGPGNGSDEASAIAIDDAANVYVTGQSVSDYATVKYDSSGNEQWVARYNGPGNDYDDANAIVVDNYGNIYVTGSSMGSTTSYDYTTIKYNSSGTEQWVARYNGPGNGYDVARAIAVDNYSNIYVTGSSVGSTGTYDYTTIKYSSSGNEQWIAQYNGPADYWDIAISIALDGENNVYITGFSDGPGTGDDFATVKHNPAGVEQWVARYNGPGNLYDYGSAIAVDSIGNAFVTGTSYGSGWIVYTTVKYNAATGIAENFSRNTPCLPDLNALPNPFTETTTIRFAIPENSYLQIVIYDISGKLIRKLLRKQEFAGTHSLNWDGNDSQGRTVPNGIYFCCLETGNFRSTKKLILVK